LKQHPELLFPQNPAPIEIKENTRKLIKMGIDPQSSAKLAGSGLINEKLKENEFLSENKQAKFKARLRSSMKNFQISEMRIS